MRIKKFKNVIGKVIVLLVLSFSGLSCNKEVSVTPPDSLPPNGVIYFDSNPRGFEIYVNNKERGRITPDSLTWLNTGSYYITLKKAFFKDTSFIVNAVDGERKSVFIDLTQNPSMMGAITCSSKPVGAMVILDGNKTGLNTPCNLLNIVPGNHYVRFHMQNYRDDSVTVSVNSSNTYSAYKFLVDTTQWQDYTQSNSKIASNDLTCVTVDKDNIVYAGSSGNSFISFDGSNWKSFYNSLSLQITCCTSDINNIKLFGTPRGFVSYNGNTLTNFGFKTSGLSDFRVQTISTDKKGNWYIGTQGGMTEVNTQNSGMQWITLNNRVITVSAIDVNNNIWMASEDGGIVQLDASNNTHYYTTSSSILQSDNITALGAGPTGEVWIGYGLDNKFGHGLTCYSSGVMTNYNAIPAYSKVSSIFIDSKNVKWVGTNQGLVKFTSPSSSTLYNYDNTGLNINGVTGIAEDSYGNVWISTNTGLYKFKGNH